MGEEEGEEEEGEFGEEEEGEEEEGGPLSPGEETFEDRDQHLQEAAAAASKYQNKKPFPSPETIEATRKGEVGAMIITSKWLGSSETSRTERDKMAQNGGEKEMNQIVESLIATTTAAAQGFDKSYLKRAREGDRKAMKKTV